jgi:hypothetical protein
MQAEREAGRAGSEERQLDQITDPAEDADVKNHRKNRFEPAFEALTGQDGRSAGEIGTALV